MQIPRRTFRDGLNAPWMTWRLQQPISVRQASSSFILNFLISLKNFRFEFGPSIEIWINFVKSSSFNSSLNDLTRSSERMCPTSSSSNSVWQPSIHWHRNILHGDPFHFSVKFYWGFHQIKQQWMETSGSDLNWLFKIRKQSIVHNIHNLSSSHLKLLGYFVIWTNASQNIPKVISRVVTVPILDTVEFPYNMCLFN